MCERLLLAARGQFPEHLSLPSVFTGIHVTRSLVLCVCFVDRCLSFCAFSFCHCVVCLSSIYRFWLPLCIFKLFFHIIRFFVSFPVCSFSAFSILFYHLEVFDCHSVVFLLQSFFLPVFFSIFVFILSYFRFLPVFFSIFVFILSYFRFLSFHSYWLCRDLYFFFCFFPLLNQCFSNSSETNKKNVRSFCL